MTFRYVPVFSMKDANLQPPLPKIQLQAISQEVSTLGFSWSTIALQYILSRSNQRPMCASSTA